MILKTKALRSRQDKESQGGQGLRWYGPAPFCRLLHALADVPENTAAFMNAFDSYTREKLDKRSNLVAAANLVGASELRALGCSIKNCDSSSLLSGTSCSWRARIVQRRPWRARIDRRHSWHARLVWRRPRRARIDRRRPRRAQIVQRRPRRA